MVSRNFKPTGELLYKYLKTLKKRHEMNDNKKRRKKTLLKINIFDAMHLITMVVLFYFKTLYFESAPLKMSLYTQSLAQKNKRNFQD